MNESNISPYVNSSFTFFQVGLLCLISLQYGLCSTDFHLDCTTWCRFMYITHVGKKSQCCLKGN